MTDELDMSDLSHGADGLSPWLLTQHDPPHLIDSSEPSEGSNNSCALRDFTAPDELSDLTLVVEGRQLHVHKQYLAEWSPVWRRMFLGRFMERDAREIPLPGKRVSEITELLHCIYSSQKPISGK